MNESMSGLHGPAIYNPGLLSKDELLQDFVARQPLLEQLLEDCKRTRPDQKSQHYLLIGLRGMGKTTMLHRLRYGFEDDEQLTAHYFPLIFPEEQYNIAHLSDLWLNCLDALGDMLEQTQGPAAAEALDQKIDALAALSRKERAEPALALLLEVATDLGRRLVLLLDNFDMILERITEQEQWAFRRLLSETTSLLLIGASAQLMEATYDYSTAFYDFFQVHELGGLSEAEMNLILTHLAERRDNPGVRTIVDTQPERVRSLRVLTGGNPRTVALLYSILAEGGDGDVRSDLEQLLDNCTPLYKARLEALANQAQLIVHELALHWDPLSAGELAKRTSLRNQSVSAQLDRLFKQGVVEKTVLYDRNKHELSSKTGYQLAERLFNIWYLMRTSRRVRRRLMWLVKFLQIVYSEQELQKQVQRCLRRKCGVSEGEQLRDAEYSFALSEAVAEPSYKYMMEHHGLTTMLSSESLRAKFNEFFDFSGEDAALLPRKEHLERLQKLAPAAHANNAKREQPLPEEEVEKAISCYGLALEVRTREAFPEQWAMTQHNLAWTYYKMRQQPNEAENAICLALEQSPENLVFTHTLACILAWRGKWDEAIVYAKRFILESGDTFREEHWASIVTFFKEMVQGEQTEKAIALLDDCQMRDVWRPLYEALVAIKDGTRNALLAVAPEIRTPSHLLIDQLMGEDWGHHPIQRRRKGR